MTNTSKFKARTTRRIELGFAHLRHSARKLKNLMITLRSTVSSSNDVLNDTKEISNAYAHRFKISNTKQTHIRLVSDLFGVVVAHQPARETVDAVVTGLVELADDAGPHRLQGLLVQLHRRRLGRVRIGRSIRGTRRRVASGGGFVQARPCYGAIISRQALAARFGFDEQGRAQKTRRRSCIGAVVHVPRSLLHMRCHRWVHSISSVGESQGKGLSANITQHQPILGRASRPHAPNTNLPRALGLSTTWGDFRGSGKRKSARAEATHGHSESFKVQACRARAGAERPVVAHSTRREPSAGQPKALVEGRCAGHTSLWCTPPPRDAIRCIARLHSAISSISIERSAMRLITILSFRTAFPAIRRVCIPAPAHRTLP